MTCFSAFATFRYVSSSSSSWKRVLTIDLLREEQENVRSISELELIVIMELTYREQNYKKVSTLQSKLTVMERKSQNKIETTVGHNLTTLNLIGSQREMVS